MRQFLFNIATAISLMLLIGSLGFIVHSCMYGADGFAVRRITYRTGSDLGFTARYDPHWVVDDCGFGMGIRHARLNLGYSRSFAADNGDPNPHRHSEYHLNGQWANPVPGGPWFNYVRRGGPPFDAPGEGQWEIAVPAPLVLLGFGILPLVAVYRRVPRKKGYCQNCGYDMRATPNRCPECGTVPHVLKVNQIRNEA